MKRIIIKSVLSASKLLALTGLLYSQSIQFSVYVASELTATRQQDLSFSDVMINQGVTPVNLGDPGMCVFSITGNQELDVIVSIDPPANLVHDGASSDVIPFTLNFAYANKGQNDINDAILATASTVRFQLLEQANQPAGPPPTPPSTGYIPTESTAYVYIFGSLDIQNITPGNYSGTVTLTVDYD